MFRQKSALIIQVVVTAIFGWLSVNAQSRPDIYLSSPKRVETSLQGEAALVRALNAGQAKPLSLAADDFDGDGMTDVAAGYATPDGGRIVVFRGNLDAFAPQSQQSFDAIGKGNFPQPFLTGASVLEVPAQPDFLATGMLIGHDGPALVAAARGGHQIYVFVLGASGKLELQQTVDVSGSISALGTYPLRSGAYVQVVVGVHGGSGSAVLLYTGSNEGLTPGISLPLTGDPTGFAFGNLDGDTTPDALVLAGGHISILHGASLSLEPVSIPFTVVKATLGSFISDRGSLLQMALLADDGSVHIFARDSIDSRPLAMEEMQARRRDHIARSLNHATVGAAAAAAADPAPEPTVIFWTEVEFFPGAGAADADGIAPQFFRTRIADNAADDIMALGAGRTTVIAHPGDNPTAGKVISRIEDANSVSAALPLRVNIDGRPGVVFLKQDGIAPFVMMPLPDPTFFPNRFDDPAPGAIASTCNNTSNVDNSSSCSLREAVRKANATSGTDTIMLAAGTYTLTQPRAAGDFTAAHGTLDVTDSVNIVGTVDGGGVPTSIIQAGTTNANGVDKIFSFNQDISSFTNASVSITNLELKFGRNLGSALGLQDGFGGAFDFDTGGTNAATATATLTITNCNIHDNQTTDGEGGGFEMFNTNNGTGTTTVTNSTVQNNTTLRSSGSDPNAAGNGGGIVLTGATSVMTLTNTKVLNNLATQIRGTGKGLAGGIANFNGSLVIHGGSISGNQAALLGGGIYSEDGLTIDQGTVISNNTSSGQAGGIWFNGRFKTASLTKVTITGNSATGVNFQGTGGGIQVDGGGMPFGINFSRLAGNSASVAGSNLANQMVATGVPGSAVTAQNNWWGTNAAGSTIAIGTTMTPTTSTCAAGAGQVCFDPFIVLTHNGNPQKIRINQSSTLTGDMSKDNHGNAIALANLGQIIGLPITFNAPVLGTIPQAQPETLNANAMATATFNAGGTSGLGSANATVDQAVVPVNSNLIASAIESGTTATITTVGVHGYSANEYVSISGVGVGGYNGNFFKILTTPTPTSFTYTAPGGLGASSGGTSNAGIIILKPPTMTKSFNPTTVATNTPSTLTFSVTNGNVIPIDGSFADALPANLVVAPTPSVVNNCGGTVTAAAGATHIDFANGATPTGTCTISVSVQSAIDNTYNNSVTLDSSDAGNATSATTATLTVINPPTISKTLGPSSIPLNTTSSLSITLSSTNVNLTISGVAFTDSLPAGLIVAIPGFLTSTCNGTATGADGATSVSLSGASLAPSTQCTITVTVKGTTAGVKTNSVQATSSNAGSSTTSTAMLSVVAPPTVSKSFNPTSVALNANSTLSFTVTNPNTFSTLSGVGFTDNLPAGLVVASSPNVVGTCGGTVTAVANSSTISLSGGTLTASPAAGSSCTFSVSVTGTTAGSMSNTTGNVTSTEGGTGTTSNTAVLNVLAPPSIAKVFNPTSIPVNTTTSLQFTITNPASNTASLTGVGFTDTLPVGLTVATASSTVCGGTLTTTNPTGITLSGATVAMNTPCVFTVTVTGATAGAYTNTTGSVTSTNGGTGNNASANLTVVAPPSITKSFNPTSIPANTNTTLSFTITNPNTASALSGVAFTDSLPAGLVVAATPNVTGTCGSGTITATAGAGTVSLSAGTLTASPAAGSSCTFSVSVTGTTGGTKTNAVTVTSTEGGTGNTSNASVTVVGPPTISKSFNPTSVPLNTNSTLSFTITNANTTSLSGVGFSDSLPSGVVVAASPNVVGSCGGTVTATAGSGSISLSGGTLTASPGAGSSCTFSVSVTGTTAGSKINVTGAVTSTEGGTGSASNAATLTVEAPPSIAKVFNPPAIAINATSTLQFTITNPAANPAPLTGVGFTDTLPTGLTVPSASSTVCGGTLTTSGGTGITLSGATIALNTPCVFTVTVTGAASGQYTNTTGTVSSTNGGTGNTASANLTVAAPPSITKSFNPTSISLNSNSTLSFTITNPNTNVALSGVAFTDSLASGLVVAAMPNVTGSCGSGTITATAGASTISLSAGTLTVSPTAGSSCTFSVSVTGTSPGLKSNSVTVTSTEGGTGNTSNASLTVVAMAGISKSFNPTSVPLGTNSTLSFTITNPNTAGGLSGLSFTDNLPSGVAVAASPNITGSCGGTVTATAGSGSVSLSGGSLTASPGAGSSCTFSVSVTGTSAGDKINITGPLVSNEGGTGSPSNAATLTVVSPPTISKAFGSPNIGLGQNTSLTFTLANPAANSAAQAGVAFTDTLPAGLQVATPNGINNMCGGSGTATAGGQSIILSGGGIPAGSSCTLSVNVKAVQVGLQSNTSGAVSSTNGGTGTTSNTAVLTVQAPDLTVSKTHSPSSFTVNDTADTIPITVTNSGTAATSGTVTVTDTLPAGLTFVSASGAGWSCGAAGSNPVICTSTTPIAMSGTSALTLTVSVASSTGSPLTNNVSVACTCTESSTGNNSNTDSIPVGQVVGITLATASPTGLLVSADGGTTYFTAPHTFQLLPNSTATIVTQSPQAGPAGTQYVFVNWSDGGAISHTITVPAMSTTYTATFKTQFLLTTGVSSATAGSISPATGFFDSGSMVPVSATANAGYVFTGFSGALSGTTTPQTITITAPATVTANFGPGPTALGGSFGTKTGPIGGQRVWTVNIGNNGPGVALGTQVTSFTVLQTSGTACNPTVLTPMPVSAGDIAPGATAPAHVTIDFTNCSSNAFFKVTATVSANSGAANGTIQRLNQLQ